MGKFQIHHTNEGEVYFSFNMSGTALLVSNFYQDLGNARGAIQTLRQKATKDFAYRRLFSKNGKAYFSFQLGKQEPIGQSPMYEFASQMEQAILKLKQHAPMAPVEGLNNQAMLTQTNFAQALAT